jgi:hypothetical protein
VLAMTETLHEVCYLALGLDDDLEEEPASSAKTTACCTRTSRVNRVTGLAPFGVRDGIVSLA